MKMILGTKPHVRKKVKRRLGRSQFKFYLSPNTIDAASNLNKAYENLQNPNVMKLIFYSLCG